VNRRATASHEAGHFYFFLRAGIPVKVAVSSASGGRVLTNASDAELHSDEYRQAILAGPVTEVEFFSHVNAPQPSVQALEEKWNHDLEFLGMSVEDILKMDRAFVIEAWSKISAVADVLDFGYAIVPRTVLLQTELSFIFDKAAQR